MQENDDDFLLTLRFSFEMSNNYSINTQGQLRYTHLEVIDQSTR